MAIGYGQTDGGDEIILSTLFFRGGERPDSHHYLFFHSAEVMEGGFGGGGEVFGMACCYQIISISYILSEITKFRDLCYFTF